MEAVLKEIYIESILLIERLHRRFLDIIKTELERLKIEDINNVQTLILYNISNEQLTIGELTNRGYYLGSNVSYNVKKLVENNYLMQEPSPHDRRSTRISLSPKGKELCAKIDALYQRHLEGLQKGEPGIDALKSLTGIMNQLERFWTECVNSAYRIK